MTTQNPKINRVRDEDRFVHGQVNCLLLLVDVWDCECNNAIGLLVHFLRVTNLTCMADCKGVCVCGAQVH